MGNLARTLIALLLAVVGLSMPLTGTSFASHDFSVPDVTADESAGSAKFVISPSCPVDKIEYKTEEGTAAAGADYRSVSGTLTSPPFEFEIPILDDSLLEENEAVRVIVSKFTFPGAAVCVGTQRVQATLTIRDDDARTASVGEDRAAPTNRSKTITPGLLEASRPLVGGSSERKSATDRDATALPNSEMPTTESTDGSTADAVHAHPLNVAEARSHRRFPAALAFGAFAMVSALALSIISRRRFAR